MPPSSPLCNTLYIIVLPLPFSLFLSFFVFLPVFLAWITVHDNKGILDNFAQWRASEMKRMEHVPMLLWMRIPERWVPRAKWEAARRLEFSGSRRKLLTAEKHGRTNADGIQRHALRLASIAASIELQASQNSKEISIFEISSFSYFRYSQFVWSSFDIFVSQRWRAKLRDVIFFKVSRNKLAR